jgi:hypothetical protein
MDDGYVLPGLNEEWTLAGAKLMEWIAGFCTALILSEVLALNVARSMPLLAIILCVTTFGMATLRRRYPDEERGVRNAAMVAMGFAPPGIPAPAPVQPLWSGAPTRDVSPTSYYAQLGLTEVFGGQDLMQE